MSEIRKLAEEVSAREGCYLYDLEFVGAPGGRALRVYIDRDATDEKEAGVSIEDCTNVSRELNQLLGDEEDPDKSLIPGGAYSLEVSSPGLERVLKEPRHFEKVIGKKIAVKTFAPLLQFNENVPELGKAKQIQGKLLSFDDKGLQVLFDPTSVGAAPRAATADGTDGSEPPVFVPFDSVTKAHVVFEYVDSSEKKPNAKGQKTGSKQGNKKSGHSK